MPTLISKPSYYPASPVPYYSLGLAFRAKGDTTAAIRYFKWPCSETLIMKAQKQQLWNSRKAEVSGL